MDERMNFSSFLLESVGKYQERDALVFEGGRWTFQRLNDRVNRLANALMNMGVVKGEHIGLFSTNCPQCVELLFAVAKAGGVLVPFNCRLREEEAVGLWNHSEITTLFFCQQYSDMMRKLTSRLPRLRRFICFENGFDEFFGYERLLSEGGTDEPALRSGDEDIALILYTSGTTGFPRGVMLSHKHIITRIQTRDMDLYKLPEMGTSLMVVPNYHSAGIQQILKNVHRPMTLVIMRQFEVAAFLTTVTKERVQSCTLIPTMIKQIIDFSDLHRYNLSSLIQLRYGAAPMPPNLLRKAMAALPGCSFTQGYGMTEGSATTLSVEDHALEDKHAQDYEKKLRRLRSVGRAIKNVEIKVVDPNRNELPVGEVGKILIKGPAILTGYWRDLKATNEVVREGWLDTGDIGYLDEDGYLFLEGREKEIIIRGGENIAPLEIEAVIEGHPKVAEVAVIGIPDPEWGETVRAIVVPKPDAEITADEIMTICNQKLAGYKRPDSVVFIDSLPKNSVGKVLKRELKDHFGKEIGSVASDVNMDRQLNK